MEFSNTYLTDFRLLLAENDIHKKLGLGPDMTKVCQALNILAKFREWHWLLSKHRKEASGIPPPKMLEDGSKMARTWMICQLNERSP
ncbi:unnamed protein product [Prunus armeniaca]